MTDLTPEQINARLQEIENDFIEDEKNHGDSQCETCSKIHFLLDLVKQLREDLAGFHKAFTTMRKTKDEEIAHLREGLSTVLFHIKGERYSFAAELLEKYLAPYTHATNA